jgi:peptidyl-prolyl cis-trans isomerase B (cyclophilin B)
VKIKLVLVLAFMLLLTACGTGEKVAEPKEEKTGSTEAANGDSGENNQTTFSAENLRQLTEGREKYPTVELVTSKGTITIELYPDVAPKAVENFITHSKNGYYDGLTFHRVMNDFMIQGGDPLGTGTGGESIFGAPFEDEFSEKVMNLRGALSMANSGPNTNGSQFFIVQNPTIDENLQSQIKQAGYPEELVEAYVKHGGTPWLDYKHTVFGHVISGIEVVDEIAAVEVDAQAKPLEPVTIEKVNVKE